MSAVHYVFHGVILRLFVGVPKRDRASLMTLLYRSVSLKTQLL